MSAYGPLSQDSSAQINLALRAWDVEWVCLDGGPDWRCCPGKDWSCRSPSFPSCHQFCRDLGYDPLASPCWGTELGQSIRMPGGVGGGSSFGGCVLQG